MHVSITHSLTQGKAHTLILACFASYILNNPLLIQGTYTVLGLGYFTITLASVCWHVSLLAVFHLEQWAMAYAINPCIRLHASLLIEWLNQPTIPDGHTNKPTCQL